MIVYPYWFKSRYIDFLLDIKYTCILRNILSDENYMYIKKYSIWWESVTGR